MRGLAAFCLTLALVAPVGAAAPVALVAVGDPSPLGLPFSTLSDVAIDDRGRVAFLGASSAIFHKTGGDIVRIAGAGDPFGGARFAALGPPALATGGCVGFRAAPVGGDPSIVRICSGGLETLVTVGTAAPGGGTFTGFGPAVAIGRDGQVAFTGLLDDGESGLFRVDAPGVVLQVVRTGLLAPAGGVLVGFRLAGVAASGAVGFRGIVTAGPDGLFVWDGMQVVRLAVVGDASPVGGQFSGFGAASVNDAGVWAFRATIERSTGSADGIFRVDASAPTPVFGAVVVEGDPSPLGGQFRELPTSIVPSINATGTVAFRSTLVDATSSAAVFVASPGGSPATVATVDDKIDVGQGAEALRRLRDPIVADDGSVLFRAALAKGTTGLFAVRDGRIRPLVLLGDATDLGKGFRFSDAVARATAESAFFLGSQEAIYISESPGRVRRLAALNERTPLGGSYIGFDAPAAGARGAIAFGATLFGGKAGEAIISAGGRKATAPVRTNLRVPGGGQIVDLFVDTVDAVARPGLASTRGSGIAFNAALGKTKANAGVFVAAGGGLRMVARAGMRAAGGTIAAFGTPANVGRGATAFVAEVRGGTSNDVLMVRSGGRLRTLAALGQATGTRLASRFRTLDPPGGANGDVLFRATLAQSGLEGVFLARQQALVAVAGSGDAAPGGGVFRTFSDETLAGSAVVFHATAGGAASARGLYRVAETPTGALTDPPPAAEAVLVAGDPSPLGGAFLDVTEERGNAAGALVFAADLRGGQAPGGLFVMPDTQRNFP